MFLMYVILNSLKSSKKHAVLPAEPWLKVAGRTRDAVGLYNAPSPPPLLPLAYADGASGFGQCPGCFITRHFSPDDLAPAVVGACELQSEEGLVWINPNSSLNFFPPEYSWFSPLSSSHLSLEEVGGVLWDFSALHHRLFLLWSVEQE